MTVFIVQQLDIHDEWCIESVHKTQLSADLKLKRIALEENYNEEETFRCLDIDEFTVLN